MPTELDPWGHPYTVIDPTRPHGAHVGIRCKTHGGTFHTKNIDFIGARTIFVNVDCLPHETRCELYSPGALAHAYLTLNGIAPELDQR